MTAIKTVHLMRYRITGQYTLGALFVGDRMLHTLERPWLNNKPNVSCIPSGVYQCNYLARTTSGKFQRVYWVQNVTGRTGILFHAGNLVEQIQGCILPGLKPGKLAGKQAVLSSGQAMEILRQHIGQESFKLIISEANHD